jgi:hypothetical protein
MGKVGELIAKLIGGGVLSDIRGILDDVITNKEEKQLLLNELYKLQSTHELQVLEIHKYITMKELDVELGIRMAAYDRDVQANNSTNSSFLARNIAPILAITFAILYITISILAMIGRINTNEAINISVINGTTNIVMLIIGYYFGSSHEKIKQSQIGDKK